MTVRWPVETFSFDVGGAVIRVRHWFSLSPEIGHPLEPQLDPRPGPKDMGLQLRRWVESKVC